MNLYEQQTANRRRTWVVMATFIALLVVLGAGVDTFLIGGGGTYLPFATIAALAFGSGQAWWSLRFGDRAILNSSHAQPLEDALAQAASEEAKLRYRQLDNVVQEMAIAAGLPKPSVYVIPDDDPNAFATGRDPAHASLAVTEGLLKAMDRDQLQGVVAHEMSHVRNLDIRLMMVVAALVGAVVLLADWTTRSMQFGGTRSRGKDEKGSGGAALILMVVWLLAAVLAPLLAQLLAMAISRRREYLADASGAELTRNPLALAGALEKIEDAAEPTAAIKRGTAHLCIADPLGRKLNDSDSGWANLWATHPPMAKRIEALKAMAFQQATSN